jgi:hypothetical protein
MIFYPVGKAVPAELRTEDLWLRVLRPDVTDLDYAALMESRERLRRWSDSTWPADDFTLEENRQDLIGHEREWENREAFTYTVLSSDGDRCEGCVYIYPLGRWLKSCDFKRQGDGDQFADETPAVTFWVRDSALGRGLDRQLLAGLREWFRREWSFDHVVFPILESLPDDVSLVEAAGLTLRATHASTSERSSLRCYIYSEPVD